MFDFQIKESEIVIELRRIADALCRLAPEPIIDQPRGKPKPVNDLMITTDETLADFEEEEERRRAVEEGDGG